MILRFLVLAGLGWGFVGCASRDKFDKAVKSGDLETVRSNLKYEFLNSSKDYNQSYPIIQATKNNDFKMVKLLVESGAKHRFGYDINGKNGFQALHIASKNGYLEIAKLLIEQGADLNFTTSYKYGGFTPLHIATINKQLEITKLLIEQGADLNIRANGYAGQYSHSTALIIALLNEDLEIAKLLIDNNASLEPAIFYEPQIYFKTTYNNPSHFTALQIALDRGYLEISKLLIEKGADINVQGQGGYQWKPLHIASSSKGHLEVVKLLIEKGADINVQGEGRYQWTPLHIASDKGHLEIVKLLIKKGADINVQGKNKWTPLHIASDKGHLEIVKLLIEKGANINLQSQYKQTPLYIASDEGHLEIVKLFIKYKAYINNRDKDELLKSALRKWNLTLAKLLIEKGANVNIQDKYDGVGIFHIVSGKGDFEFAKFLIGKGANVNIQDKYGRTPLYYALEKENFEFAKFLIGKGANIDIVVNNRDETLLLYYASKYNRVQTVKFLIENGANVNRKNKNGLSPLYLSRNEYKTFNYLLSLQSSHKPVVITKRFTDDKKKPKLTLAFSEESKRAIKRVQKKEKSQNILSSSTIQLTGSVVDDSKIVEAKVNKVPISLDFQGNFTINLPVKNGDNSFTLFAKDRFGNSSTKEITIKNVVINSNPLNWYRNQYALIIGIDRYKNREIPTLSNAVNDAKKLSQILETQGFKVISLYNEKATKREIFKAVRDIASKTGKLDNFLFYFAGHGQGLKLNSGDRVGYLIPFDSEIDLESQNVFDFDEEAIALTQVQKYAKDIPSNHVALLLDSCFSGLAMSDKRVLKNPIEMNSDYYNDILSRKAINILTAGDDQPVSDGSGHSPFATAIIEGMEKRGLDINDRDGFATFTELATYVKTKVEKATNREQRPQFDNLSAEDGDFIFKLR
jgi:ankyrin repeat protein